MRRGVISEALDAIYSYVEKKGEDYMERNNLRDRKILLAELMGVAMQATKGAANPKIIQDVINQEFFNNV